MTFKLIAFCGAKGCGKDTAAEVLTNTGWENVKFAGALKAMVRRLLEYRNMPESYIERMIEGDLKEVAAPSLNHRTPREVMQSLGTEWGRDLVCNNLWLECFTDRVLKYPKVVCTDLRFPNEAELIQTLGGVIIRVIRPGLVLGEDLHSSEQSADFDVDYTLVNDGSIENLQSQLTNIILPGVLNNE